MQQPRQQHKFTVTFSDREWYILEKILAAKGEEPELHIHDAVVGLFNCDIDDSFGVESKMRAELHRCDDALRAAKVDKP